jgi:hypothetical protein
VPSPVLMVASVTRPIVAYMTSRRQIGDPCRVVAGDNDIRDHGACRLGSALRGLGFRVVLEPDIDGDVGIRFSNSADFGRFVSTAVSLLAGEEIVRVGSGCLATLSWQAAGLICHRAGAPGGCLR